VILLTHNSVYGRRCKGAASDFKKVKCYQNCYQLPRPAGSGAELRRAGRKANAFWSWKILKVLGPTFHQVSRRTFAFTSSQLMLGNDCPLPFGYMPLLRVTSNHMNDYISEVCCILENFEAWPRGKSTRLYSEYTRRSSPRPVAAIVATIGRHCANEHHSQCDVLTLLYCLL